MIYSLYYEMDFNLFRKWIYAVLKLLIVLVIFSSSCSVNLFSQGACANADGREELFDTLVQQTLRREAFSPIKNQILNIDYQNDVEYLRNEFRDADDDTKFSRAIQQLNSLRRDRHLNIDDEGNTYSVNFRTFNREGSIRFWPDFSDGEYSYFISDLSQFAPSNVSLGDELLEINNLDVEAFANSLKSTITYSTINGSRWGISEELSKYAIIHDPSLYTNGSTSISFKLRRIDNTTYDVTINLRDPDDHVWGTPLSVDFSGTNYILVQTRASHRLYRDNTNNRLLLYWLDFEEVADNVQDLMDYAQSEGILNWDLILYTPFSGGGSNSPLLLERLANKPFKTTFGNIRISDLATQFVNSTYSSGHKVRNWYESAVNAGLAYTSNAPFKLRHFSNPNDTGVMQPESIRFTGNVVAVFSSLGGSNLDQCSATIIDNNMMCTLGYPTGGYSNTWEYPNVSGDNDHNIPIVCPNNPTEQLLEYQWTIGQTIRPNGEVLEGNPPKVHYMRELNKNNFTSYWKDLITDAEVLLQDPACIALRDIPCIDQDNDGLCANVDCDDNDPNETNTCNVIYVDKDFNGVEVGSENNPLSTFKAALEIVPNEGEIIFLSSGNHEEIANSIQKILLQRGIKITLQNGGAAVIIK